MSQRSEFGATSSISPREKLTHFRKNEYSPSLSHFLNHASHSSSNSGPKDFRNHGVIVGSQPIVNRTFMRSCFKFSGNIPPDPYLDHWCSAVNPSVSCRFGSDFSLNI